jgi:deoxyribodipyrimidine photo-lyase
VEFIWASVDALGKRLRARGGDLLVLHGRARTEIVRLAERLGIDAIVAARDYEPAARARDDAVAAALAASGRRLRLVKDTVVYECDEIMTQAGRPFSVFTPYKRAWLTRLTDADLHEHASAGNMRAPGRLMRAPFDALLPTLEAMGFSRTNLLDIGVVPGAPGAAELLAKFDAHIDEYKTARDFPAVRGVSYLSVHNRFGTVSIRAQARLARARGGLGADTWLSELIWRDFYFQILWHHPHVVERAFKPQYEALAWENDATLFDAWCQARTGYPIVDAAMRQLNTTGYMHNRLRMIVASFLTKDLLIDWRWGERYFAARLNDFDLSANNGGWQWAASTGCDAQPYFRIFNPVSQSERFDPQGRFIKRYLPELEPLSERYVHAPWTLPPLEQQALGFTPGRDYPLPVVEHAVQRDRALAMFKAVSVPGA